MLFHLFPLKRGWIRLGLSADPADEEGDPAAFHPWTEARRHIREWHTAPRSWQKWSPEELLDAFKAMCATDVLGTIGHYVTYPGDPDADAVKRKVHLGYIAQVMQRERLSDGEMTLPGMRFTQIKRRKDIVRFRKRA